MQNIEDRHIGKWKTNREENCPSADEWSMQDGNSGNTVTSGDELASDQAMDDIDDGNEHLNSSLRDLYGVINMQGKGDPPRERYRIVCLCLSFRMSSFTSTTGM